MDIHEIKTVKPKFKGETIHEPDLEYIVIMHYLRGRTLKVAAEMAKQYFECFEEKPLYGAILCDDGFEDRIVFADPPHEPYICESVEEIITYCQELKKKFPVTQYYVVSLDSKKEVKNKLLEVL